MSIREAVAVLNRAHHGGHDGWHVVESGGRSFVHGVEALREAFTEFEAVAIAEAYCATRRRTPE